MLAGVTLAPVDPPAPRPVNPALCVPAPSVNVRLAVREPVVVGAKRIVAEQLDEAARVVPHVFV